MHIALIPRKGYVGMLSHLTKFQLVVPKQLVGRAESHLTRFKERGHYIILDNGVFEGDEYSIEELLNKAGPFAKEIVLPDVFQDGDATFEKIMENIESVIKPSNQQKYFRFMIVPQGKDQIEWLDNFYKLYNQLHPYSQNYVWGMPKWLGRNDPGLRARLLKLVSRHSTFVTWHMLGCNSVEELRQLVVTEMQGFAIRSLDTSLPFKLAMEGKQIHSKATSEFSSASFFSAGGEMKGDELSLTVKNVVQFLDYANYEQYKEKR